MSLSPLEIALIITFSALVFINIILFIRRIFISIDYEEKQRILKEQEEAINGLEKSVNELEKTIEKLMKR